MQGQENLFPRYASLTRPWEKRQYVLERLVELVSEVPRRPRLATQLFRQDGSILRHIGHILTGIQVQEGRQSIVAVPYELQQCMVRVRSVDGSPIRYKAGKKVSHLIYRGRDENRRGIPRHVDDWQYPCGPEGTQGDLPLPIAWRVLGFGGKGCLTFRSQKLREKHEIFEEMEVDESPASLRKRGGRHE